MSSPGNSTGLGNSTIFGDANNNTSFGGSGNDTSSTPDSTLGSPIVFDWVAIFAGHVDAKRLAGEWAFDCLSEPWLNMGIAALFTWVLYDFGQYKSISDEATYSPPYFDAHSHYNR